MKRDGRTMRAAVAGYLTLTCALSCGCRPEIPDDPTFFGQALVVPVRQYPRYSDIGRRYGPGIQICQYYPRKAVSLNEFVFEVCNLSDHPVDWVAWNHRFSYEESSQSPFDGHFMMRSHRALTRCIYLGRLEARQGVMCLIDNDVSGPGFNVWGEGKVTGTLAGTGRRRPRADAVAKRYTGQEWLVPGRKFIRSRLDELLERLRTAVPAEAEEDMKTLLYASRRVNDDLPLVKKPEIVAAFVDLLLKAERRPRTEDVEDEEPDRRVIRVSELFDPFEFCLLTLLELVPPEQLRPHGEALGALSVHAFDRQVVELLIKAGSARALTELAAAPERLPKAGRDGLLLAVRAASGDEKAHSALLDRFAAAKGEVEKAGLARLLAALGREDGLKAIAGQLRDTREFYREGEGRQTVRSALTDALRLAYPEELVLYVWLRPGKAEMTAVEKFCSERLGVKIEGEVPEAEYEKPRTIYHTIEEALQKKAAPQTPEEGKELHESE